MMNKKILKFILDVLVEQEQVYRKKNQLVQDSLWRLVKDKDRYEKEHQKYLDALELIQSLLQDNTK
jgi:hypothetical protein